MKKLIPLFFVMILSFSACSAASPPDLGNYFTYEATVNFNDVSYKAEIDYHDNIVYFTPTSTNASGMTISCDGSIVTYSYDNMINTSDMTKVSPSNPCVALYEIITEFHQSDIKSNDELFTVDGTVTAGNFTLVLNTDGKIISIDIPDINLYILFTQKN